MSFTRIKRKGNRKYAYEITSYYDKELKKPRQKTRYIGTVTKEGIQRKQISSSPRRALDFGDIALMQRIAGSIGLVDTLMKCYNQEAVNTILALAINRNVRGVAMKNFQNWFDGTYLVKSLEIIHPTSQNLSRFLDQIGSDEHSLQLFFDSWQEKLGSKDTVMYDITSMGSSSKLIDMLEYGYSRDDDGLPQINFGLVADMFNKLPVFFKTFPGSIPDVSTLNNLIMELKSIRIDRTLFILDKGFYSRRNISLLMDSHVGFIMSMPFHIKSAQKLLSMSNRRIVSPKNVVMFNAHSLYVLSGKVKINDYDINYFHYFDECRKARETDTFYRRLEEIEQAIAEEKIFSWSEAKNALDEIAKKYAKCFSWTRSDKGFALKRKPKAISRLINRMGKMILIYSGDLNWETALSYYRGKDAVEKMFDSMKNELDALPVRVQKESTLKGSLFVTFVAIILHFELLNRMKANTLNKLYSSEGLLMELSKIKKIELLDGTEVLSEVTKKARTILEKLQQTDMVPNL